MTLIELSGVNSHINTFEVIYYQWISLEPPHQKRSLFYTRFFPVGCWFRLMRSKHEKFYFFSMFARLVTRRKLNFQKKMQTFERKDQLYKKYILKVNVIKGYF